MKKLISFIVFVSIIFVMGGCQASTMETKNDGKGTDYSLSVKSAIEQKEDCCICGNGERSMMDYYRKSGMIGLVCLNTMHISNLDTRLYSDDGAVIIEPGKDGGSMYNTYDNGNISVDIHGLESRGIFEATIYYDTESRIDFNKIKEFLCQECLNKVVGMYEDCMEWTNGDGRFPQMCLVDFKTNELYPLSSHEREYDIREFRVYINHEKDTDEVLIIYAPEVTIG